jgi:DUF4097 and DUF4098 domain-containing protein YvlB
MSRLTLPLVLLGATVVALPTAQAQPVRQRLDTTFAFTDGTVDVRSVSGPITITTWNRKEAKIAAWIERGEIAAELSSSRIRLEAKSVRGRMGDHEFVLTVPVGTRVDAQAVSGDVSVRGTRAAVAAEAVSGDVRVDEAEGSVDLTSVSGDVVAERVSGTLQVESVSGDVRLREAGGRLNGSSVSGSVDVDGRLESLRLETVSGDLTYRGTLDSRGRYAMQAHSGEITLVLPTDARADVTAKTFSGELDSEFPMTLGGDGVRSRRDRMRFTLGGGGATVDLETFSGTITLRKAGAKSSRED